MQTYQNFLFDFQQVPINNARLGTLHTPHGIVETPNFIFCATKASIKLLPSHQASAIGSQIILSNTYHLMLNPGAEHIAQQGGLHKFMNWNKPMLTDSGGYQVFAMGHGSVSEEIKKSSTRNLPKTMLAIQEEGVTFKSYLDGSKFVLSPEKSIAIQKDLGADLIMQFDECTPYHVDKLYTAEAMHRSLRWGARSIDEFIKLDTGVQAMYGIVQGGVYEDLRKESAETILTQNFWGNAIGGSLGFDKNQMKDIIAMTSALVRSKRPIHLLGIGDIPDIFFGVRQGIDTFDCVHPTRIARHACAIVPAHINAHGKLNLKNHAHSFEDIAIDPDCTQDCCKYYSRAYIHHLFKAKELLGMYLLTMHNVAQIVRLMSEIRKSLKQVQEQQNSTALNQLERFWLGI